MQVLLLAQPLDRAYLITIWLTAARVREVNNLTWEDVDFERRTIRLWTRKKKRGNLTPRLVAMVDKIFESLQYVWNVREKNSPYVFTNPVMVERYPGTNAKWKYVYRDNFFDTICRKAGFPEMGYHAIRHHADSALADANVPITTIQEILGHGRETTTDNYLQSLGQSVANGMEKINV